MRFDMCHKLEASAAPVIVLLPMPGNPECRAAVVKSTVVVDEGATA